MGTDKNRVKAAIKTLEAPRVQDVHPSYVDNLPQDQNQMSLEEFMRRNPKTIVKDKIKESVKKKTTGPRTRETARSRRENPRKPVPVKKLWKTDLVERVERSINTIPDPGDAIDEQG